MSIGQLPQLLGANSNPICFPLIGVPVFRHNCFSANVLISIVVATASAVTVSSAVWAPLLLPKRKQVSSPVGLANLETGDAILYLLRGRVLNRPASILTRSSSLDRCSTIESSSRWSAVQLSAGTVGCIKSER